MRNPAGKRIKNNSINDLHIIFDIFLQCFCGGRAINPAQRMCDIVGIAENVIPKLEDQKRVSREIAARMVAAYLCADNEPVVIADWPEDLSNLMMLAIITPDVTYRCMTIPGFVTADQSKVPHNALEDAKALKEFCHDAGI
jgi:hypothetical protein